MIKEFEIQAAQSGINAIMGDKNFLSHIKKVPPIFLNLFICRFFSDFSNSCIVLLINLFNNLKRIFTEIYCPALEPPFRGSILPLSCASDRVNIRRNTMCTYQCETGHNLANGDRSLTCNTDGTWSGRVPYCTRELIALRASDVEFMFVRLYNLFLHFKQKKMAH
jgi:hypothetical protein